MRVLVLRDEAGVPLLDEDYLILSTIQSAKGREWTSVFVFNTVDGCIPSDCDQAATCRRHGLADQAISEHGTAEGPADERCHHGLSQCRAPLSPN